MFRKVIDVLKERPWYQTIAALSMFDKRVAQGFQRGIAEARGEVVSMNTINVYRKKKRMRLKIGRRILGLFARSLRRFGMARRRFHAIEPNLILYGLKRDAGRE